MKTANNLLCFFSTCSQYLSEIPLRRLCVLLVCLLAYFQPYAQIRLNAGFPYGTIDIFDADDYFTVPDSKEAGNGSIVIPGGITNPLIEEEIYLSTRSSFLYGGSFGYDIPVVCGKYDVILHFAEIYYGAPDGDPCVDCTGKRIFNIDIENGADGITNYDVYVAAGGSVTGTSLTFSNVNVYDGSLDIDFIGVIDGPIITAIEVLPTLGATEATFIADAGCTLGANTFNDGSFQVSNTSPGGQYITNVSFDLSTAILPYLAFDPSGTAGDITGKNFTANSGALDVLPGVHSFSGGIGNGGYTHLSIPFTDFAPGESFTFSVDIDPTSIEGLLTGETSLAAALSGSELLGATVVIEFSDGSTEQRQLYPKDACTGASEVVISSCNNIVPPVVKSTVNSSPTLVYNANQYYTVYGVPGDEACVWVAKSDYVNATRAAIGAEGNDVSAVAQYCNTIAADGKVSIPFSLFDNDGDINRVSSVIRRVNLISKVSNFQILEKSDLPADPSQSVCINVGALASLGDSPITIDGKTFELDDDTYWTNGDLGHASYLTGPDPISNTNADEIFLKDRHGFDMSFAYPGLTPGGNYAIQLYFAETWHGVTGGNPAGGSGDRIMDVAIEGNSFLTDFDVYDLYGPTAANIQTYSSITVSGDGILNIDFTKPSGPDVPSIQAIAIISIDNSSIFPVELIGFEAFPRAHEIGIKWSTASEINNHFFTVEKSLDNRIFETIGRVDGAGNSQEQRDYEMTDNQPLPGISYYRLKQTDFDGSYSYSNVVAVNFTPGLTAINVYPNPSDGKTLYVNLAGYAPDKVVNIHIFDMLGRSIYSNRVDVGPSGNQLVRVELSSGKALSGLYNVQIVDGYKSLTKQLVIER